MSIASHSLRAVVCVVALAASACGHAASDAPPPKTQAPAAPKITIADEAKSVFDAENARGTFVLLDLVTGDTTFVDRALAETRFSPCSTFKLPNSLIGLDSGVVDGPHFTLKWDGKERWMPEWNRDHDLASAIKYSVVWYYQEVARRVGIERMQHYVDAFDYGNRDLSGGVDQFWLESSLKISPLEQVAFLKKLRARTLPVAKKHMETLESLVVLDEQPGFVLRGKTGSGNTDTESLGWLVGLADRDGHSYAYAMLMLGKPDELKRIQPLRRKVTETLLTRFGARP